MSNIKPFILMLALFFALSSPASAFYVANVSSGRVTISQGVVLGDDDDKEEKKEDEKKEEKKEDKREEKRDEKREDKKPAENKVEQKRQEQLKEQEKKKQEIKKQATKESAKIQKKLDLNSKNINLLIDPNKNTLSVNQNSAENIKKLKELQKKKLELQRELQKKNFENDEKQTELLEEQLKKNNELIKSSKSKVINEVSDDDLEISSENGLKIKTDDDLPENELEVEIEDVKVKSTLPVGVNAETNNLVVKTPEQEIETEHTPNKVLEDLKSKNLVDEFTVGQTDLPESAIVMEDNKPIYEIKGSKNAKFLWVIPVKIDKDIKVSVETGEVLNTKQSNFSRFLDLFSF